MKRTLYILTVSTLMASCASVLNGPYATIKIHTTEPSRVVYKNDTTKTVNNKAILHAQRKKETLTIKVLTDSLEKAIELNPMNSFAYWYNIIGNYGIGMLADKNNPKRYTYPRRIYLNSADTISKFYRYSLSNNKGELHLHLSLPYINTFQLTPENENIKANTGFWGLTIGFDYYHKTNQFLNLGLSGVTDFFVPVPAAVDISGEYELMSSRYVSISNNYKLRRFTVGYGLSYSRNTWDLKYYDRFDAAPPTREPVKKSNNTFGLVISTYFQTGEHFNVGVVYRPSFYRPNVNDKFQYEHLISIDFAWKIRLKQ